MIHKTAHRMHIHSVKSQTKGERVFIIATVSMRHFGKDKLYFSFDKYLEPYITADFNPFVAALLFPSMKRGEDLIVDGEIDEKLYQGMQQIMETAQSWGIGLKKINIQATGYKKDVYMPVKEASFFSLGVDSFYTYLSHKKKIDSFILVNGFDINLANKTLWNTTVTNIKQVTKKESVDLILSESNIRKFLEPILPWDFTHGGCLAATALCLRKLIKITYIASSYQIEQQFPWGSHSAIDPYWSTETLTLIHDGADTLRVDKVRKEIAKSKLALDHIRVCCVNRKNNYNCGTCEKCLRTMLNLLCADALKRSKTFPNDIDVTALTNLRISDMHDAIFYEENYARLKEKNIYPEIQKIVKDKLTPVKPNNNLLSLIMKQILWIDFNYFRSMSYSIFSFIQSKSY